MQNVEVVQETVSYSGRVRKIDLDERYFELRNIENSGAQHIRCIYKDYSDSQATEWLNKQVTVTGINMRSYNQRLVIVQVKTVDVNFA